MKNTKRKAHALHFSLIELLIVIAIIAILTAFLMPALQRARAQAKYIGCAGNLRQIAGAISGYSDDYEAYLPPLWGANESVAWRMKVSPYLGKENVMSPVLFCPAHAFKAPTYGISNGFKDNSKSDATQYTAYRSTVITKPSRTMLAGDGCYKDSWGCSSSIIMKITDEPLGISYRHSLRAGFAFCDHHVESILMFAPASITTLNP